VGVVAAELYPDWKAPGVFAVQAVCARTYALHERQRSIDRGQEWDLESTEEDQAYKGGTAKPEAVRAVRETRGVVLTWNGHLLRTYYSSTCGGRVAAAADVWPTGPGYEFNLDAPIQAHHRETLCQSSPRYRWDVTRDRAAFSKQLRDWGKAKNHAIAGLGMFKSMSVEKLNADGRPSRYSIEDGAGKSFLITAELLRTACNYKAPGLPALTKDTLVRSGDVEIEVKGNNVVIHGRGFGHGVGMCQFCAKAMAERGDTWQSMVVRFYPGSKIERAY
jgi:stage II sporulation protein D